ncbi:hypothetical protein GALL_383320 [mine drainage metagenome]|uniref:Uncharacterized protein n=1 Tax=mine drainage metagenome TaxID=410659 RepID=A0A1J5QR00_9ZZZZ
MDHAHHGVQCRSITLPNGIFDQCSVVRRAPLHGDDQGQGGFALAQVVTDVLAQFRRIAAVVEQIVDQLECSADRAAGLGGLVLGRSIGPGQHGANAGGGFE